MASLLNTSAPFNSELSMILQLTALVVLLLAFIVVKRKKYKSHGFLMSVAGLLNVLSIVFVMLPSVLELDNVSISGFNLLFRAHVVIGVFVLLVSVCILSEWRFREPGLTCFQRKKWMLGLALAWMGQIIIGMLLFLRLYV